MWSTKRQALLRMSLKNWTVSGQYANLRHANLNAPSRILHTHAHPRRRVLVHLLQRNSILTLHILTSTYLYLDGICDASQLTLCWLEYRFPLTRSLLAFHTGRQDTICRTLLLGFRTRRRISCTEIKERSLIRYMGGRIVTSSLVTLRPRATWVCKLPVLGYTLNSEMRMYN